MEKILIIIFLFFVQPTWSSEVEFQSGDIIFQTSSSNQSYAIMWASKSLYSHVGVIEIDGNDKYVIEAKSKVDRTPLNEWIERGRFGRYSLFRYPNLDDKKRQEIVSQAKTYLDRKYDIFFTSKNDEIYCSELVELAFQKAGVPIGKIQKVKELDVDNFLVRKLVEQRWRKHPACKTGIDKFEDCWNLILEDELTTPASLAADTKITKVWSNYPSFAVSPNIP